LRPVIAIVGRPNVGKSTLFNRLTQTRNALVANEPGLTRDRQYGLIYRGGKAWILIDTGGLSGEDTFMDQKTVEQVELAIEEAHCLLFLVDAHSGCTPGDEQIAAQLRKTGKTVLMAVNKSESLSPDAVMAEFFSLGFPLTSISATRGVGMEELHQVLLEATLDEQSTEDSVPLQGIRCAIVGRPNVGKSTLVNRILGEDRVIASEVPGTTRDSIFIPFERDGQQFTLIDTAGVRRKGKVKETVEKFSVVKTLQSIEQSDVVALVLDAHEGISDQDAALMGFVVDAGRSVLIVVNKWDGLDEPQRKKIRAELERKFHFAQFASSVFISALHGSGVGTLFQPLKQIYASAVRQCATHKLSELLGEAIRKNPPPLSHGRRIKLNFAHQGGQRPPTIVVHGNQTQKVPAHYHRYLENFSIQALSLKGTPLRVIFKTGENPYKGQKNTLTQRQLKKRKRLIRHVKKR